MSKIIRKITTGFVIQTWDGNKNVWTAQEFIAADETNYEDEDGNTVESFDEETYLPFDMVQPFCPGDIVYWSDPDGGECSGYFSVKEVKGDVLTLEGTYGSCVEAHANELIKGMIQDTVKY